MFARTDEEESEQLAEALWRSCRLQEEEGGQGAPIAPPAAAGPCEPEGEPSAPRVAVQANASSSGFSQTSVHVTVVEAPRAAAEGSPAAADAPAPPPQAESCADSRQPSPEPSDSGEAQGPAGASATALALALERAGTAGEQAALKLAGRQRRVAASPTPPAEFGGTKVFFVVVRARHDLQAEGGSHDELKKPTAQERGGPRGLVVGPWALARGYVCSDRGGIVAEAIFHGFATRAEAEAYWRGAVGDIALPTLPPRRV